MKTTFAIWAVLLFLSLSILSAKAPEPASEHENKYPLGAKLVLTTSKEINTPTGKLIESEHISGEPSGLLLMISKSTDGVDVTFFSRGNYEITLGSIGPDGRPKVVVVMNGDHLVTILVRRPGALLAPIDAPQLKKQRARFTEFSEPSEIVGEIISEFKNPK